MELFDATFLHSQLFWTSLSFGILFIAMAKFVAPAIAKVLDERAASIKADLDQAKQQQQESERVLAEYQKQLNDAREEASQLVADARAQADALTSERMKQLEEDITKRSAAAAASIEQAKQKAMAEVQAEVASLAVNVAEKALDGLVDSKGAEKSVTAALKSLN